MSDLAGTQVGTDGKRHSLADLTDVPSSIKRGVAATLLPSASRSSSDTSTPAEVGSLTEARLDLTVTAHGGTNEIQTVTLANATGGTFTLTYAGQTTTGIAYNAAATAVQSALEALSNIAVGDVAVTGSAGGPYTVTFGGALADSNVAQMTASAGSLTGSSPTVTVATQTPGVTPTLDVTVQTGPTAEGPWTSAGTFTQATAAGSEHKVFGGLDEYVRLSYTIAGGAVTFEVSGQVV